MQYYRYGATKLNKFGWAGIHLSYKYKLVLSMKGLKTICQKENGL